MDARHIAVLVLMLATFAVLATGVGLMMFGGRLNEKYGNRLMVWRVTLQGLTVLLIGLLFLSHK